MPRKIRPPHERFWEKVSKNGSIPKGRPGLGPCWEGNAGVTAQGYGGFHPSKTVTELAHRWSYREFYGSLDVALVVDHLCRNRLCVNPGHLEQVPNEENLRRGAGYGLQNGMRSHCRNGHEYTPANTYTQPDGNIRCRACARIRDARPERNATLRRKIYNERQAA